VAFPWACFQQLVPALLAFNYMVNYYSAWHLHTAVFYNMTLAEKKHIHFDPPFHDTNAALKP
jgi:hypothetical protein